MCDMCVCVQYHIFYQLCAGLSAAQKAKFKLKDALSYTFLNQSGNVRIDDVDDAEEFQEMSNAFKTIGFSPAEVDAVLQVTCGVLHLGNVGFTSAGEKKSEVDNKAALQDAAALFEVTTADLVKATTSRVMRMKGQADITISLSKHEAESMRNALASTPALSSPSLLPRPSSFFHHLLCRAVLMRCSIVLCVHRVRVR
jgi:myosin heavy subunit